LDWFVRGGRLSVFPAAAETAQGRRSGVAVVEGSGLGDAAFAAELTLGDAERGKNQGRREDEEE